MSSCAYVVFENLLNSAVSQTRSGDLFELFDTRPAHTVTWHGGFFFWPVSVGATVVGVIAGVFLKQTCAASPVLLTINRVPAI